LPESFQRLSIILLFNPEKNVFQSNIPIFVIDKEKNWNSKNIQKLRYNFLELEKLEI